MTADGPVEFAVPHDFSERQYMFALVRCQPQWAVWEDLRSGTAQTSGDWRAGSFSCAPTIYWADGDAQLVAVPPPYDCEDRSYLFSLGGGRHSRMVLCCGLVVIDEEVVH
jgi:hypothetical protein